ncbi:MAG: DUF2793 domain-containing protein [Sulfitobacter sp.]|nr:DUF2793 domain-containing protein [Sulfitobacter sp.]
MSQTSPSLSLPYLQPAQAQKHITHNEALRILDAVTQLSVIDATRTAPPAAPTEGDRHIVAPGATGDWYDRDNAVAIWSDTAWHFAAPSTGWRADIAGTAEVIRFDGTAWVALATGGGGPVSFQNLPEVGVNTTADNVNRLAVSSEATLLNHAGSGHQLKLNKASTGETASLLFQTGFSGRAEMGTAGSDDFAIKISTDGATYHTAISVDADTGAVQIPTGQNYFADVFIVNDSVYSFDIPWSNPARIMMWLSVNIGGRFYMIAVTGSMTNAGNFSEIFASPPGTLTFLTGALTGTTGPAGGINLAIEANGGSPRMHIENRLGSNRLFTLATMGK